MKDNSVNNKTKKKIFRYLDSHIGILGILFAPPKIKITFEEMILRPKIMIFLDSTCPKIVELTLQPTLYLKICPKTKVL